jgi:zinc transport system substrate-binding protein
MLQEATGVALLPIRSGGGFEDEAEAHGDAGHGDGHGDGRDHAHGSHDGHLWLDPANAVASAQAIAVALAAVDPENAAAYAANAEAFAAETRAQSQAIAERLDPLRGRPFIVFHDAYHYFERAFDFPAAGSIALQDGVAPGAGRVAAIRDRVRDEGVVCAFAEPEFEPKLLATVIEGSAARTGVLDGLGAALPPGPGLYPALIEGITAALEACLAP